MFGKTNDEACCEDEESGQGCTLGKSPQQMLSAGKS